MSQNAGRYARWSVAALVAPLSAAAFAGAVSWSTAHGPQPAAAGTTVLTGAAEAAEAPIEQSVELEDADHSTAVASLRAQVSALTAQLAAAQAGPAERPARSTTRTRTSAPTTSRPRTTARATSRAASTRTPPPVHTTTGASG